jgi:hypothetical protein
MLGEGEVVTVSERMYLGIASENVVFAPITTTSVW